MPEQEIGGTQRDFRTVASFRTWRGWESSAAPSLPRQIKGYLMYESVSNLFVYYLCYLKNTKSIFMLRLTVTFRQI